MIGKPARPTMRRQAQQQFGRRPLSARSSACGVVSCFQSWLDGQDGVGGQ